MSSSTKSLSEILTNTNTPIANRSKNIIIKPNSKTPLTKLVDILLDDYSELIDPAYKKWFAGKFYKIPREQVQRCASEARQEGRDPRRLFAFKIKSYQGAGASKPF